MTHITPTLTIKDTARNIKEFLKTNNDVYWHLVKSIMPWVIGLYVIDIVITMTFFAESKHGFSLGGIISGYFFSVLVISWHRVVIYGAEKAIAMNPFKPKKHEIAFIGMGILLTIATFFVGLIGGVLVAFSPSIGAIILLILAPAAIYLGYKFSFYFPAKATNNSISLKQSYSLTKGYFWKLTGASALASVKYLLLFFAYAIVSAILVVIISAITGATPDNHSILNNMLGFVFGLPLLIYFYPKFYVIGVTCLSNYYLHAVQNKS